MYLIPIAWLYVALMMAVAEATNSTGSLLGALITLVLYGLAPVALLVYLMGGPQRRRATLAREAAELAAYRVRNEAGERASAAPGESERPSGPPDAGGHAAADTVTPVRKES